LNKFACLIFKTSFRMQVYLLPWWLLFLKLSLCSKWRRV